MIPAETAPSADSAAVVRRPGMALAAAGFATPVAASFWLRYVGDPFGPHPPVLCLARGLVGLPCPFCGLTTSFTAMAGADPGTAATAAPLGPLLWLGLLAAAIVCAVWAVRGSPPTPALPVLARARTLKPLTWVLVSVGVMLLSWGYQLLWGPYAPG